MSKEPRHGRVTQPQSLLHLIRSKSRPAAPRSHRLASSPPTGTRIVDELGRLREYRTMALRLIQFLAIILTALALVPSGAHLAALPNKMAMAQAAYFIAQQMYAGWALFGIVLFGALLANLAHTIVLCRLGRSFGYALASPSSSSGPSRQIKRPTTGRLCLRTGLSCVSDGSIRTPPTPS